jgi:serine phosphatase RsbU (regulator of sigma subunit)
MAQRYSTPRHLVEALQQRGDGARAQLHDMLHAPLTRLMEELRSRFRLQHKSEILTRNALHAAETYIRTLPQASFATLAWPAFRAAVLLHIAKLASQPHGQSSPERMPPTALPHTLRYGSEVFFLPHERIGDFWFGGDWFGGHVSADGALWILLADITGHGYHAYLLASALPGVWQRCWETPPSAPVQLLADMHDLLEDCLPEGVYVECTLACLHSDGRIVVVPAGGSRLLLRRGNGHKTILLKLRGGWLGLIRPSVNDQQTLSLQEGGELVLATDGLFDQLHEYRPVDGIDSLIRGEGDLFERVCDLLQQALKQTTQKDDITVVRVIRRAAPDVRREDLPSSDNGCSDVPV